MVLVRRLVREWDRAAFGAPCTPHANIPLARLDRVRECLGVLALEHHVPASVSHLAWRPRQALEIGHRVDTRSGAAETIATKSRRKVQ